MIHAYHIALIPPKGFIEMCYKINVSIANRKSIDFQNLGQLPHITLLMGGVDINTITAIQEKLKNILDKVEPIDITLVGIDEGKFASGLIVKKNTKLIELHRSIVAELGEQFTEVVSHDNVIGLPNVTDGTIKIINNYQNKSILENYDPHITIGDGVPTVDNRLFPLTFTSKDVRLARTGNYCTFIDSY